MSKKTTFLKKLKKHFIDDEAEVEDSNGVSIESNSMEHDSSLDKDLSSFVVPDEEDEEEENQNKKTKEMYIQSLKEDDDNDDIKEIISGKMKPKSFKRKKLPIHNNNNKNKNSANSDKGTVLKKKHERDNEQEQQNKLDKQETDDVMKAQLGGKTKEKKDVPIIQKSIIGFLKPKEPAHNTRPAIQKQNMKISTPAESEIDNDKMKIDTPAEKIVTKLGNDESAKNDNQLTLPTISFPPNMNITPHQKALFNQQLQKLFMQLLTNKLEEEETNNKKEEINTQQQQQNKNYTLENVTQMEITPFNLNEKKDILIKDDTEMKQELKKDLQENLEQVIEEVIEIEEPKRVEEGEGKEKEEEIKEHKNKFTFVPFVVKKNKIDDTEIKQIKKKALQGKHLKKEEKKKLKKYNNEPKYKIDLVEEKEHTQELKKEEIESIEQMQKIAAGVSQTSIDNQLETLRKLIEQHGENEHLLSMIMKDVENQKLLQLDLKSERPTLVQIKDKPIRIRRNNETYFLMTFKDEIAFAKPGHKGAFVKIDGTELGGMETIETGTSKRFRLASTSFFLTYPRCPISTLGTFRRTFLAMAKSRGYEITHLLICREYHSSEEIKEAAVNEALSSIGPKSKLDQLVPFLNKQVRYVDFDKKYKEETEKGYGYDARGDVHYHVMMTLTERKFITSPRAFDLTLQTTGKYDEKDEFYPIFDYPIKGKDAIHGNYQHMHDPESSRHYILKTLYAYNEQHKGEDPEPKVKDWFFYESGNLVIAEQMKKHTTAMHNKKILEKSNRELVMDGDIHINTLPLIAKARQILAHDDAEKYAAEFAKQAINERQNIWMAGMSGGGKSTLADKYFCAPEDCAYHSTGEITWWDGFEVGVNKKVIIDDLIQRPGVLSKIKEFVSEMMGKLPVKGGHTKPTYDSLIITANWFPWDMDGADLHNEIYPLCRKIRMIAVYPEHFCVPFDKPLPQDYRVALQPVITRIAIAKHQGDLIVKLIDKERLYMPYPREYHWLNMAAHLFKAYKVALTGLWLNNKMPNDEVIGENEIYRHETGLMYYHEPEKKLYPVYKVHYSKELGMLYHPRIKISEYDLCGLLDLNFNMIQPKIYIRPECIMPADEARKKCPVEVPVITRTVKEITKKNETSLE